MAIPAIIWPDCEDPYPFMWFSDDVCMMHVDERHVKAGFIMISYLCWDLVTMVLITKNEIKNPREFIFHHFITMLGIAMALVTGTGVLNCFNNQILMELPTIFLNYRSLVVDEGFGSAESPWFLWNNLTFVILFTLTKIIMYPFVLMKFPAIGYYMWDIFGLLRKTTFTISFTMAILVFLL